MGAVRENERTAVLVGTVSRQYTNLAKEQGKYFVTGVLDVTQKRDKSRVYFKFKAWGKWAKLIIDEAQSGAKLLLQGGIGSQLKNWRDKNAGYEPVINISEHKDLCGKAIILSGGISDIGDMESLTASELSKSYDRINGGR